MMAGENLEIEEKIQRRLSQEVDEMLEALDQKVRSGKVAEDQDLRLRKWLLALKRKR